MKKTIALSLCLAAAAALANPKTLTLWRGETLYCPDCEIDATSLPAGLSVRNGLAREVAYTLLDGKGRPAGRKTFHDRVEWGAGGEGRKVAEISAAADMKPGAYKAGETEIVVIDRVLPPPAKWNYYLDLWQHPWAVSRYCGVKPFSEEHFKAMEPLWRLLADAGNKTLTVTITRLPWNHQCYDGYDSMIGRVKRADGSWAFDYSVFDRYVEFGRACGLGPDISCYTMCPWSYMVYWKDAEGKVQKAKAVPGTAVFNDFWGDFLVDFAKHLKEKGWFNNTYIALDERSPKDVKEIVGFVNAKAPGLKVSLAGNKPPSQFEGIKIDNCTFALGHLSDKLIGEAASRKKQGLITSYYVCCSPARPNTFCHSSLEESYWIGAYPAMSGLDGFLRWAWNSWPKDPDHDATFLENGRRWASGDTYLAYPGGKPSLRFLELRNGIVAAEKLSILKKSGAELSGFAALAAKYNRKAALAGKCDFKALRRETQELVNRP